MSDDNTPQEAPGGSSEALGADAATKGQPKDAGPQNLSHGEGSSSESFDRSYVEELRAESRQRRQEAAAAQQRADFLATEVRRLAIREAARAAGLVDPEALAWTDDYTDDKTGLPDHDRLRQAAESLAQAKPWLSRPTGSVRQGEHGTEQQPVSLSELLRAG